MAMHRDLESNASNVSCFWSIPLESNIAKTQVEKESSLDSVSAEPQALKEIRDPFANENEDGTQYKTMSWWQGGMVMVAETISLGILSLPKALSVLGIVPGIILLLVLGAIASYTGYVIGQFKLAFPQVHNMADAGYILGGRVGREILGFGQIMFLILIMGSHILTFGIMMNALTDHGACTVVFMVLGTIVSLILTLPRTLKNMAFLSIASFISIFGAVLTTMIGVAIETPKPGNITLWGPPNTPFHTTFLAVANIIFAYAGHAAFFSFASELKVTEDFPKSLAFLQVADISMYTVTAVVVYYYAGPSVQSPALDSVSHVIRKVAYGIAMPTIVIAGVVNAHVAVKYVYVRCFRDSKDDILHQRSWRAYGYWAAITAGLWLLAWLIAEIVPVFEDLLGLSSALFASWFTFGLSGFFWLHMNRNGWFASKKKMLMFVMSIVNILLGLAICVIGLYSSGTSIAINIRQKTVGGPFSCADNSSHR